MLKNKCLWILVIVLFPLICIAQKNNKITWPSNYEPSKSKFYVHNEIEINAPAEKIWEVLIAAKQWGNWYKGAKNVSYLNKNDDNLGLGTTFQWETMGLSFESTIKEFKPNQLLAWESVKKSIQGYHVWLIIPTETGCRVITDESQNGWLTFFEKTFQKNKLKQLHDDWLEELKLKAETNQIKK